MILKDSTFAWPETYSPVDSDNCKCLAFSTVTIRTEMNENRFSKINVELIAIHVSI